MTTLKDLLLRTQKNLLILREREAKQASTPDLRLLNEIDDHQTAIKLIQAALSSELTEADLAALKESLRPLLVADNVERVELDELKLDIPPLPFEPETILIPAGPFLMGSPDSKNGPAAERPQHQVELAAYQIGKYPVTNEQYAEFIKQSKHRPPQKVGWLGPTPPQQRLDHPVVAVSWYDVLAYCAWLSEQTGRAYRLPSEAEWEKAARGTDGRIYPWGNSWDANCCNGTSSQTTPVTAYPAGRSPYGCCDMIGNVWEWTSTLWGPDWQQSDYAYPYRPDDGRENGSATGTVYRLFRGGAFDDELSQLRCAARCWYAPDHAGKTRGFRVAMSLEGSI